MLTPLTQTAIAILYDIAHGGTSDNLPHYALFMNTVSELLAKLESGGLIRCINPDKRDNLSSYELTRPTFEISLLELLEMTGEHLNCNYPTNEALYSRYPGAAAKLGVVNQMTRVYLSEIKLNDLF